MRQKTIQIEKTISQVLSGVCLVDVYNDFRKAEKAYWEKHRTSTSAFNLIQEIHLDNKRMYENAHTRILGAILQYNNCQFLESFLKRCGLKVGYLPHSQEKIHVEVEYQYKKDNGKWTHKKGIKRQDQESEDYCRPDCLIWNPKQFAIIIENKINDAVETDHQVDNYISAVLDDSKTIGLKNENQIRVVYLGGDTFVMPTNQSLNKGKPFLIYKGKKQGPPEAGKNLSLISYKEDIIPWLEEDVLPQCPIGMSGLTGGLLVYIDYLKKRFVDNLSEEGKFFDSNEIVGIFRKCEKSLLPFFYARYTNVSNYIQNDNSSPVLLSFFRALRHYFLKHHFRFSESEAELNNQIWAIRTPGAYIHVWKRAWEGFQSKQHPTCDLFFELFPYQVDEYLSDPSKNGNRAFTCSLRYKGNDDKFLMALKKENVTINEYVFSKERQKNDDMVLTIKQNDTSFFDSFVQDPIISAICNKIDKALKDYSK